jgi:hypothetical protein
MKNTLETPPESTSSLEDSKPKKDDLEQVVLLRAKSR